MYDAFVSYSRKNRAFVEMLAGELERAGRKIFVDLTGIDASTKWLSEIRSAIVGANAFLFVISPASVGSQACRQELEHAVQFKKRLITILLEPAGPLPPELASIQWISFEDSCDRAAAVAAMERALTENREYVRRHTSLLGRAQAWVASGRSPGSLLFGDELEQADEWLGSAEAAKGAVPTDEQRELIEASRAWRVNEANRWKHAYETSLARQLIAQAMLLMEREPAQIECAILLLIESLLRAPSPEGNAVLHQPLSLMPCAAADLGLGPGIALPFAFSPDGQFFARAVDERNIVIIRIRDGTQLARVRHESHINQIVFTSDSSRFATASGDKTAAVWRTLDGERVASFDHPEAVGIVAVNAAGDLLATACPDRFVRLWDINSGTRRRELPHGDAVNSVAFHPGGKLLATAAGALATRLMKKQGDDSARMWDVESGRELARYEHGNNVQDVVFSPGGKFLASASLDGTARLYDVETLAEVRRVGGAPVLHDDGPLRARLGDSHGSRGRGRAPLRLCPVDRVQSRRPATADPLE